MFLSVISLSASDLREKNQLIDFVEDQTQVVQQGDTSLSLAIGQLLLGNGFWCHANDAMQTPQVGTQSDIGEDRY